jgi:hypothetical protein
LFGSLKVERLYGQRFETIREGKVTRFPGIFAIQVAVSLVVYW